MVNMLEERLSTLPTNISLYHLHSMGGNHLFCEGLPLKCTTATETLLMHRTTFLCLSLVSMSHTWPRKRIFRTFPFCVPTMQILTSFGIIERKIFEHKYKIENEWHWYLQYVAITAPGCHIAPKLNLFPCICLSKQCIIAYHAIDDSKVENRKIRKMPLSPPRWLIALRVEHNIFTRPSEK